MALNFPNGTRFGFSTALGVAVTMSAVTNAKPPIATLTGGTITEGDVIIVKSAWPDLNDRIAVAGVPATGTPLLGLDTTDTNDFPENEGAGLVIPVTTFVDLSQQGDPTMNGGDQQYYTGQYLESRSNRQFQVPTVRTPRTISVPLDYDPALPWYDALIEADRRREPVVLRARLPKTGTTAVTLYYYANVSFDGTPSMAMNNPMQNAANFSLISEFTRIEEAA